MTSNLAVSGQDITPFNAISTKQIAACARSIREYQDPAKIVGGREYRSCLEMQINSLKSPFSQNCVGKVFYELSTS